MTHQQCLKMLIELSKYQWQPWIRNLLESPIRLWYNMVLGGSLQTNTLGVEEQCGALVTWWLKLYVGFICSHKLVAIVRASYREEGLTY